MTSGTERTDRRDRRAGLALVAGAVLCLVAAGGLLWGRYGGLVFNDLVTATLAWCF